MPTLPAHGAPTGPRLVQGGPLARLFAPEGEILGPEPRRFDLLPDFETTADSGLRHTQGTVSLARDLLDTGSVTPALLTRLQTHLGAHWQAPAGAEPSVEAVVGRLLDR